MAVGTKAIFRLDEDLYPNTLTGKNKCGVALENGAFVEIGTLVGDGLDRETYEIKKVSGEKGKKVGFISSPALMYDENKDERDYECATDELVRVYIPNASTVGTFAEKHFDNASGLAVGDILVANASTNQLKKSTGSEEPVGVVEAKEDFEGQASIVVRFL